MLINIVTEQLRSVPSIRKDLVSRENYIAHKEDALDFTEIMALFTKTHVGAIIHMRNNLSHQHTIRDTDVPLFVEELNKVLIHIYS